MKELLSIDEICRRYNELFSKLGGMHPVRPYVTFDHFFDGIPNIRVDEKGYHYEDSERGKMYIQTTQDIQELFYWVFYDITYSLASHYALYNPYPSNWKQRRITWKNQLELLGKISQDFKEKCKLEIMEILKDAPLEDGLPNNMDYETWEYPGKHENKHLTQIPSIDSLITQISTEDF